MTSAEQALKSGAVTAHPEHLGHVIFIAAVAAMGGFLFGYRILARRFILQGGGEGHPEAGGPEGRSSAAKVALSDNVVGGPTAGLAGRQACGDLVRPPSGGRGR